MARSKQASKRKGRRRSLPLAGAAVALAFAGGASATTPTEANPCNLLAEAAGAAAPVEAARCEEPVEAVEAVAAAAPPAAGCGRVRPGSTSASGARRGRLRDRVPVRRCARL